MPIVAIQANIAVVSTGGSIVGSQGAGSTITHNFGASSIWGHAALQSFSTESDVDTTQPSANVVVSKFTDQNGVHHPNIGGVFSINQKCINITYQMTGADGGSASAMCITEFFG